MILASCTKKPEESKYPGANKLPFETLFSLGKGGEELEFEIEITEQKLYSFGVMFKVNDKIPNDRVALIKLVGSPERDKNNKYVDLGVPLAMHLQIISLDSTKAKFEFDKTTSEVVLESWGSGMYNKNIFYVRLEPNRYKVTVKNLLAAPEFNSRDINFYVYRAYVGK
jgi:Domain of unknown function (DUF5625)